MAHQSHKRLTIRQGGPNSAAAARKRTPRQRAVPTKAMQLYTAMLKRR